LCSERNFTLFMTDRRAAVTDAVAEEVRRVESDHFLDKEESAPEVEAAAHAYSVSGLLSRLKNRDSQAWQRVEPVGIGECGEDLVDRRWDCPSGADV
jgi:hypothetical protein